MGIYLNSDNVDFYNAVNHSQIYVDKTNLIRYTNKVMFGEQKFICVSRPRRFGKSITANMLSAYYSRGCDSKNLFCNFKIAESDSFEKHLNKYNTIRINMLSFMEESQNVNEMIQFLKEDLIEELISEYNDVNFPKRQTLMKILSTIFLQTKIAFVFIIDEWDCILRDKKIDDQEKKQYLDFLCALFKGQSYVALAYMTGILPIKKYGGQSELNMFTEVSMTDPREYKEFTGFTEDEVKKLCEQYDMSFEETKRWYNGYNLMGVSIYNPRSVVMSMTGGYLSNYWTGTETYDALRNHIMLNFDGLKDKVARLIAGDKIIVNTTKFQNDMTSMNSADDILTLLVHLGYLTYDFNDKTVWIPNSEVQQEFINSIEDGGWEEVMHSINQSENLLKATIKCEEEKVSEMVEEAHRSNVSILKYNDENSLSCVLSLAYYSARRNYSIYREMPGGEGYADLVFVPRKNCSEPAMIIELKCNDAAETAIEQIKNKKYSECLMDYSGEILLVGISYDKDAKKNNKSHVCIIEKIVK